MALAIKDRVKETSTTTGTGTYTLAGAVTGFETFGSVGNGNTTYYCCTDGTNFEVGIGTYTSSGTTLARTTVLQSSNSDSAVNWSSGTRTIFCTYPADKAVYLNASDQLVIGGTAVTSTAAELNIMDGVTSTAAEINLIDGGTARGTTAVASGDGLLVNDGGTMRMTNVDTVSTYFSSHNVGGGNIVTTGALNSGSITSGFGTIDTGSSTITTTGLISGGSLDIDDVVVNGTTIGHTDDTDLITLADGIATVAGEISVTTLDIGGTNVTSTAAELNILDGVTSTASELNILDGVTSTATELNLLDGVTSTTAELNYNDTGSAVGTVVASKTVTVDANKDVASFRNITLTGELDAATGDFSGDVDVDGTLEADAITVNGATLNSVIADEATALAIALG